MTITLLLPRLCPADAQRFATNLLGALVDVDGRLGTVEVCQLSVRTDEKPTPHDPGQFTLVSRFEARLDVEEVG